MAQVFAFWLDSVPANQPSIPKYWRELGRSGIHRSKYIILSWSANMDSRRNETSNI